MLSARRNDHLLTGKSFAVICAAALFAAACGNKSDDGAADDAYAVAFEHALRDVGENGLRGEVERDMFESQIKSWHGNLSLFVTSRKSL